MDITDILQPKKCQTCPYKQGLIKAKLDPCIQCKASGRKTHPFPMPVEIHEGKRCAKCGSNRFVNGKCAVFGAKFTSRF